MLARGKSSGSGLCLGLVGVGARGSPARVGVAFKGEGGLRSRVRANLLDEPALAMVLIVPKVDGVAPQQPLGLGLGLDLGLGLGSRIRVRVRVRP